MSLLPTPHSISHYLCDIFLQSHSNVLNLKINPLSTADSVVEKLRFSLKVPVVFPFSFSQLNISIVN